MTLGRLTVVEPDAKRAERVRARCRAAIERRRTTLRFERAAGFTLAAIEVALLGTLSLAYLAAFIITALRVYGFR